MSGVEPLVSCIMPTWNRREFVPLAIRYFLRQDYDRRELIVVDDGDDCVEDLIPDDPRVRYLRLEGRHRVGEKRNLACERARGELIAHWDDDDWSAPHRLRVQVGALRGADACGSVELLYYELEGGRAWRYRYSGRRRPWVVGGTLVYRHDVWRRSPFPDLHVGEETPFLDRLAPERVRVLEDSSYYVGLIHRRNTAGKSLSTRQWERRSLDEVTARLGADREHYIRLRDGSSGAAPPARRARHALSLAAPFYVYDGYGSLAEYLALGMERAGAGVHAIPLGIDPRGLTPALRDILARSSGGVVDPVLYVCWPREDLRSFRDAPNLFVYTMWEGSRLPPGWAAELRAARAVIVPTRFVQRVCRDSGVTAPVEVVPPGVDPQVYRYEERPERAGLTTLIVGTVVPRKHAVEAIAAWKRAFAGDPAARLVIKSRFRHGGYAPDDPRIRFVDASETTRGIAHYYREADVLLALGSEGFGLPLVEGMATGLPAIALSSEGQGDVCEDARGMLLPVRPARWEPCDDSGFGPGGVRGVPGLDDVAERLRWVATHRAEARAMGRAASEWALERRDVWRMGPAVLEVMERHLRSPRALRRPPHLWVPSWRSACGIAEYTRHLLEALPEARAASGPPDSGTARVLHVQHEHSLFAPDAFARSIRLARSSGTPVAVTVHTVTGHAQAWEREADVLVSLTERGADLLRSRLPRQRVESLPHGCPTWFPERKRSRGRVIGTFGFLERHKGMWSLLEVVAKLRGTELLMYSHSRSPEVEAEWERSARGLPVRRMSRFAHVEEAARGLAAEADVLVFWYDEQEHASASGAVRVGLATGVPVLASPTRWFADLRGPTYQPEALVAGVERLLADTDLRREVCAAAVDFCNEHSWRSSAERHRALWASL